MPQTSFTLARLQPCHKLPMSSQSPLNVAPHWVCLHPLPSRIPRIPLLRYRALRPTNVTAVAGLIELLGDRKTPPPLVVFVSTMSVIPVAAAAAAAGWTAELSLVPPACAAALESGYAQTKLIAEHHLAAAAAAGRIRLVIARLGLIGPDSAPSQPPLPPPPPPPPPPQQPELPRPQSQPLLPSQQPPPPLRAQREARRGVGDLSAGDLSARRDWLSLLMGAVQATGASPAGLTSGGRGVAVLPADTAAAALAAQAAEGVSSHVATPPPSSSAPPPSPSAPPPSPSAPSAPPSAPSAPRRLEAISVRHLDAAAFGLPSRPLASFLDEVEAARGAGAPPLRRELPYLAWRCLVASAGPPASLALAMLPPPKAGGGALRLPSGARRRLREIEHLQVSGGVA